MCLRTGGCTWNKLALIRAMLTWVKLLLSSRSNFTRQDFGGVWNLRAMKQRYNLSPATMSFYGRLHLLTACYLSLLTPLSKSRAGCSAYGTNFWVAFKSKSGALNFPKSAFFPTKRNNKCFATVKYTLDVFLRKTLYSVIINFLWWFGAPVWKMKFKFWK